MAFMVPDYYYGRMWTCWDCNSDQCIFPWDEFTKTEAEEMCGGAGQVTVELSAPGWWVRLSAPGYMDQTEWSGPWDTETKARNDVIDTWDVDPDDGEEWDPNAPGAHYKLRDEPLTQDGFIDASRRRDTRILRKRKAGVPSTTKRVTPPKRLKTEKERLMDFFFGRKKR